MSKCKITGKVLAVQLGRHTSQLVLLGGDGAVLHSAVVNTPPGAVEDGAIRDVEAVRSMLKEALREPGFKRVYQVVFSLCTTQVITETVSTPDLSPAKLEKLLQANVDMYFPVDMQDYHLVWQVVGHKTNETGLREAVVQLWAVPMEMLSRYYTVANRAGLSVAAIDYCGHSIATAVGAGFTRSARAAAKKPKKLDWNKEISFGKKKEPEAPEVPEAVAAPLEVRENLETDLHVTLERDFLGMTFVQAGQVVHQRFVRCGDNPAYQFGEIAMMVEYFRSLDMGRGSQVRAVLSGTLAGSREIREDLEDMLGLQVARLEGDFDPRMILCMGAAATTMDFGIADLNAASKSRKHVRTQLWQYGAILGAGLVLMAVVMLTLSSRLVWKAQLGSLKATQQTLTIQAQKYAGYADNYKEYSAKYDSYEQDWKTIFDCLKTYNNNLVLVLQELEGILPENSTVTKLNINPAALEVQFACETKEEAAYLIMALRDLKYAEPAQIFNLQGGGGGAATEYGSGEETEEAPAEGSNNDLDADRMNIVNLIVTTTDEDTVWEIAMNLNENQAADMEKKYGGKPENTYKTIDALVAAPAPVDQRKEALEKMLTENFYAIYHFPELVMEDMEREQDILFSLIVDDLLLPENEDMLDAMAGGTISDGKTAREYNQRLVPILLKDTQRLEATEKLFATNKAMEQWYIYHLECVLKVQKEQPIAYLDMNKVINDLLKGGWKTDFKGLNQKLDNLLSVDVWEAVHTLAKTDISQYTDAELNWMLKQYMDTGNSGNDQINAMLDQYGETLDSGSPRLNNLINNFDESKVKDPSATTPTEPKPTEPKPTTPETPNTENSNPYLDKIASLSDSQVCLAMNMYLQGYEVNADLENIISQYLNTGSTGHQAADNKINGCVKKLWATYIANGSTGYGEIDKVLATFKSKQKTAYPGLDKVLMSFVDVRDLDIGTQTGTGGGGGGGVQDTRIFFNAILAYKEDLIHAELARKGLSAEEKLEKLEVAEK